MWRPAKPGRILDRDARGPQAGTGDAVHSGDQTQPRPCPPQGTGQVLLGNAASGLVLSNLV